MYTDINFKSKKELKTALAAGKRIGTFQPGGMFAPKTDGNVCLEGPHYPMPHRWYATAILKDGCVVSVK